MTRDVPRLGGFYLQLRSLCEERHPCGDQSQAASLPPAVLLCAPQARPALFQARGKPFSAGPFGRACVSNTDRRHRPRLAGNAFRCIRWRDGMSMARAQRAGMDGENFDHYGCHNAFKHCRAGTGKEPPHAPGARGGSGRAACDGVASFGIHAFTQLGDRLPDGPRYTGKEPVTWWRALKWLENTSPLNALPERELKNAMVLNAVPVSAKATAYEN